MKKILLLTATVTPQTPDGGRHFDPGTRRGHYVNALRRWYTLALVEGVDIEIHFAENSGADLASIKDEAIPGGSNIVRLLSVRPPTLDQRRRGKGACEASLFNEWSRQANNFEDLASSLVLKCTGRLFIPNLRQCIKGVGRSQFLVDVPRGESDWFDSRLVGGDVLSLDSFFQQAELCCDDRAGVNLEHVLASFAKGLATTRKHAVATFADRPVFIGASGHTGLRYDPTNRSRVDATVARLRRRVNRYPLDQRGKGVWN